MKRFFKKLAAKVLLAAVFGAAAVFTSCEQSGGGFDYVDGAQSSSSSPEVVIANLSASANADYDYGIYQTNALPGEATGTFTVYVKNVQPGKVFVKSADAQVTFVASGVTATTASDTVGEGAWKSIVTYSVAENLTLSEGETALSTSASIITMFSTLDAITKSVDIKASYIQESEAYKLTSFTVDNAVEHGFTISWTNPEGVTFNSVTYRVYQLVETTDADSGETVTVKTLVEEGALSDANAGTLTTSSVLASESKFYVEVTAVASDGWYTSNTGDLVIETPNDVTPPKAPAVTFDSTVALEESIVLTYTKYGSEDDTKYLKFTLTCTDETGAESVTVPALADAVTRTAVDENDTALSYDATNGLDVSAVPTTGTSTITISGLERAKVAHSYRITVVAVDAAGNTSDQTTGNANEESERVTTVDAVTKADTVAPTITPAAANGFTTAKITWETDDTDLASIVVKQGETVVTTLTDISAIMGSSAFYVASGLTSGTEYTYTLIATDTAGNTADGVAVTVETKALAVTAEPKYTGSILVTWTEGADYNADGEEVSYTYDVSGAGPTTVTAQTALTDGKAGAHFTGLTVGSDYTFTVTPSSTVSAATSDAVTAKTVVWDILNGYNSDRYLAWPTGSSGTTYNTGAVATSANPVAYHWIVRPALSGTDDYFSLEAAATTDGVGTGYFLYYDTNERGYVAYNGSWGAGDGKPYAMVATLTGIENNGTSYISDTAYASFTFGTSVKGTGWSKLICEKDERYLQHASLTFSMKTSSTSEDTAGCGAFKVNSTAYAAVDYSVDAPAAPTDVTASAKTDTTVTLTWTNPADADFGYVVISCSDSSVASVTSTGSSATISGLTAATNYTFTVTSYDVYENACVTPATLDVTTNELIEYPTDVAATVKYTGSVLVTWTDIAATGYKYKVTCSDANVAAQEDITEGTQKAYFTDLTVGTEVTFTVIATKSGTEYKSDTESVATVTPKIILWKIANTFEVASKNTYAACWCPYITDSVSHNYIHTCDWSDQGMIFNHWIVWPSLSNPDDTEQFSLEASTSTAQKTGYYMALDSTIAWTSSNEYVTKGWWGDSYSKKESAHFHTETADTITTNMTSLAYASFKFVAESTCGVTVLDSDTYSAWYCIQVGADLASPYYVYDTALILSGETGYTVNSGDYAFAYKETKLDAYGAALDDETIAKLAVE